MDVNFDKDYDDFLKYDLPNFDENKLNIIVGHGHYFRRHVYGEGLGANPFGMKANGKEADYKAPNGSCFLMKYTINNGKLITKKYCGHIEPPKKFDPGEHDIPPSLIVVI